MKKLYSFSENEKNLHYSAAMHKYNLKFLFYFVEKTKSTQDEHALRTFLTKEGEMRDDLELL